MPGAGGVQQVFDFMAQVMNITQVQKTCDSLDAVERSEDGVDGFHVQGIGFQGEHV